MRISDWSSDVCSSDLETGGRLGLITPLTGNFCEGCNRVRLTATGKLYLCLGQNDQVDLRELVRRNDDDDLLDAALDGAMAIKPKGHDFSIAKGAAPAVSRHMSVTGDRKSTRLNSSHSCA